MVVVLVGPTGIGKTRAAFEIARAIGAEVVVADSRQAYARLHIATNHPPDEYRQAIRYHGIELVDPVTGTVNVSDFLTAARRAIEEAGAGAPGGRPVVVEGGSMLWVDALTEGYDLAGAPEDPGRRAQLLEMPLDELAARVRALDPQAGVDWLNRRRLVRAAEILERHGPPLAGRRGRTPPPWTIVRLGIRAPMATIERRLRARCAEQVARGLVAETEAALEAGVSRRHPVLTGIGYAQAVARLEGDLDDRTLPEAMLRANRRYAKRQLAWFGRHPNTHWFEAEPDPVPAMLSLLESVT